MIILWSRDKEYQSAIFRQWCLDNEHITGLVISNESEAEKFYLANRDRFPMSYHNITTGQTPYHFFYPDLIKYIGEPRSTFDLYKKDKLTWATCNVLGNIMRYKRFCIVDEPEIRLLKDIKHYECNMSLSSYRNLICSIPLFRFMQLWFRIDKIRIYGRNNQLKHWKEIDKLFPTRQTSVNIHLAKNEKDFDILIIYALETNKRIVLYCADEMEYNYELFFNALSRQIINIRIEKTTIGSWL